MTARITPRKILASIGGIALIFCAGYGFGSIAAKTMNYLNDDTPTAITNS